MNNRWLITMQDGERLKKEKTEARSWLRLRETHLKQQGKHDTICNFIFQSMVQSGRRGVSELDNIKVLPYPRELPQTNVYKSNSCLSPFSGLFLTPLYTHTLFYFAFLNSPAPFSSPQPPPHFLFLPLNSLQIQPPSPLPSL